MTSAAVTKLMEYRGPRIGDAASLWNFAPAPGWTHEELFIFKLCLQQYGVGSWQAIQRTGLLPGKLVQQMVGQAQRLLGQQSLSAFTGLQLDIDRIRADNAQRTDVQRKAGLIIYTGPTATSDMREGWRREMQEKYGLDAATLREVAAELEELAARRLDTLGGEGLPGAAARSGLHDVLECDASQLPPALALRLLKRLRTKLGVLVDRLRGRLGLPAAEKRSWEEALGVPAIVAADVDAGLDEAGEASDGDGEGERTDAAPPALAPLPKPVRIRGDNGRRGRRAANLAKAGAQPSAAAPASGPASEAKKPSKGRKKRRRGGGSSGDECGDGGDEAGSLLRGAMWRAVMEAAAVDDGGDSGGDAGATQGQKSSMPSPAADLPPSNRRSKKKSDAQAAWEAATEADITALQSMGFPRSKARAALAEVGGSMEDALDWLLTHVV